MWIFLLLWSCVCIAAVIAQTAIFGHRGERLDIRCPYKSGYESNSKYFCKGDCNFINKKIVVKSGSPAKDERFSLTDDKSRRVFTVSISDLRSEDEGLYWCAVKRSLPLPDVYSEILLQVRLDERTTEFQFLITSTLVSSAPLTPQTLLGQTSVPHSDLFIIIPSVGLVLLLISAVLLVVVVRKKRKMCGLVFFSVEELHVTSRKREENAYERENPTAVSNIHPSQSDAGPAPNDFHSPPDPDLDYVNAAASVRSDVNPDQIYTQLDSSRQSQVYESLRTSSVQKASVYHSINQAQ
ncbi:CMRF35-like molecule 3 isoform X3 [Puntigrus tetrazona]|uniref:CMRF35-like molecule 3 isoform X3 n=1 Tax=Puntigrus tetrazona TaxID=1606681 RepID=UPI001C88F873|nr:CMRF35-like molecule 3 isoform X3 [Puntigrus tetrazona]